MKRTVFSLLLFLTASIAGASPKFMGQWIWSYRDKTLYEAGRTSFPDLRAAIWVGTVSWGNGEFSHKLALSPTLADSPVIVIRLDDSVSQSWKEPSLRTAEALNEQIGTILSHVTGSGIPIVAVQLDYDCPVGQLENWSSALKILKKGALQNSDVWITTLISHIQTAAFGLLFRGTIAGHILQVFDTGDAFRDDRPASLVADLEKQGLPFQVGFGAFERKSRTGALTQHGEWLRNLPVFAKSPLYRGAWIFPAGQPWIARIKEVL